MLDFKNAHLPELVVLWCFKQWLPTQLLFVIAQNFAPCRIHFGQRERLPTVNLCGNEPIVWFTDVHFLQHCLTVVRFGATFVSRQLGAAAAGSLFSCQ